MGIEQHSDAALLDYFVRASALFGEQVRAVTDDDWYSPTPCSQWDVRTVVAHVVVGDAQVAVLLGGGAVDRVEEFDPTVIGKNPLATWRGTALSAIRAFSESGALEKRYDHPVGHVTGRRIIGFRITDSLVHAWDIAQACGRTVELAPDIAQFCLDFWQPLAAGLPHSGFFAPAQMPAPGADAGDRLLALLGRVG